MQRHGAFPKPIQQVFCSRGRDGQNGKSIPPFDHRQLLFVVGGAQLIKAEEFVKFAKKTKSSAVPSRLIWIGFGVEILSSGIKLGWVDQLRFHDFHQANNSWWFAVGVIKKSLVTHAHAAHEIAGLIVANAIPEGRSLTTQIIDAIGIRFAFHQPKGHKPQSSHFILSSLWWTASKDARFVSRHSDVGLHQVAEMIASGFEVLVLIETGAGW